MKPRTGQQRLDGIGGDANTARMRRYVDRQLRAQRNLGHLEPVDDGLVGLAMTLADAMDDEVKAPEPSRYTLGTLAGRLLPVLLELRGERRDAGGDPVDVELAQLVAAVRDAARSRPADDGLGDAGPSGPATT